MISFVILLFSLFSIFNTSWADQTVYLNRPENSITWEPYFSQTSITAGINETIHFVANFSSFPTGTEVIKSLVMSSHFRILFLFSGVLQNPTSALAALITQKVNKLK
jgi:hypothetical protein